MGWLVLIHSLRCVTGENKRWLLLKRTAVSSGEISISLSQSRGRECRYRGAKEFLGAHWKHLGRCEEVRLGNIQNQNENMSVDT